jgi:hypothetical protein
LPNWENYLHAHTFWGSFEMSPRSCERVVFHFSFCRDLLQLAP